MPTIPIYGIDCTLPDQPKNTLIDGHKLPVKKQKFRRVDWVASLGEVEIDEEENPVYTEVQLRLIDREIDRCTNGFWFMNKGAATYLPGIAYYYYTYWILENKVYPEFRESDRLFFIFFVHCLKHPKIKGLVRIKNRRLGATSIGSCISVHIATFAPNKNCGNVSKTDNDARKLFNKMIVWGFYHLPQFLRPRVDTASTNKNEMHFIEPPKKGKAAKGRTIEGLNSLIDFMSTSIGSYDSTRLSFIIVDESGKWKKVDIRAYLDVVIECVSEGAKKKGFIYMPTTVNEPKEGGSNFKEIWDGSDHITNGIGNTATSMVRFFMASYLCMAGFFDEYGHSVVDPPDAVTLKFLIEAQKTEEEDERIEPSDLAKGAKKYLEDELAKLTDPVRIDAFKRKYPMRETDSFSFGSTVSPFNLTKIQDQINDLVANPIPLRRGRLVLNFEKKVEFFDDPKGNWLFYKFPKQTNQFEIRNACCYPTNTHNYGSGADTFRLDKVQELGSNGCIVVGEKMDITSDEDTGDVCGYYLGRPGLKELFFREILLCSLYFGCTCTVEKDATDAYIKYFRQENPLGVNCLPLLGKKPDITIDPNRRTRDKALQRGEIGVSSADAFVFARQIEVAAIFIEKYVYLIKFLDILQDLYVLDPSDRTKRDLSMGFMLMLLNVLGDNRAKQIERRHKPIMRQYVVGA